MERGRVALRVVAGTSAKSADVEEPLTLDTAFRRYSPYVAAVALRILGRDDEVDDIVQDVFLGAIKGFDQLRDPGAAKAWLATVTVRSCRRRLRTRRLRSFFGFDDIAGFDELVAPGASPEQRALLGRVYRVLDALPVDDRIAWVLRHLEGEKLEDVASACACSLATAKRRIASAQQSIERALSDA
jgi:RNA polymerase sigma-70 factor (ECF subfamily)